MTRWILIGWCVCTLLACGEKSSSVSTVEGAKLAPNMMYVEDTYEQSWQKLLEIIQYDYLYELDLAEKQRGFFSTKKVLELPRRHQITGTLTSNNQQTLIKLYHHAEIKHPDGKWQALPSDTSLEKAILQTYLNKP